MYLTDSTKLIIEKKKDRYVTHYEIDVNFIKSKIDLLVASTVEINGNITKPF